MNEQFTIIVSFKTFKKLNLVRNLNCLWKVSKYRPDHIYFENSN